MCGIARIFAHPDFRSWLQADIQSPEIDFRFAPNSGHSRGRHLLPVMPSRPGEFHPEPLTDPDVILSHHPAHAIARRLPPSAEQLGSSRHNRLAQVQRR